MMRILHVLDRSLPNLSGYSIRSYNILINQRLFGLCPIAITSEKQQSDQDMDVYDDIVYYRTSPKNVNKALKMPFLKELVQIKNLQNHVLGLLEKEKVNLVHAHSPCIWGIAALLAARKQDIPTVYEIRAFWEDAAVDAGKLRYNFPKYRMIRGLETWLCKQVRRVVVISKALKKDLIQRGIAAEKIVVVPNCVDTTKFAPMPKDMALVKKYALNGYFVIGFIGSFFDFEGIDILLRATASVSRKYNNFKVLLVGSGEKEEYLKQLALNLGIKHIIFTGRVPHEEVKRFYSVIDTMVYPRKSRRITELVTPLKPLEAMSMGKPVIMSDVGGHKELVSDPDACIFFQKDSPKDLVQKLILINEHAARKRKVAKSGLNYVREKRDWKFVTHRYSDIYADILGS